MKLFSSYQTVFYITHVCNFNCENCNSFNNYHFAGVQKWKDHADSIKQWSKIFDVGYWEVCGGETMTNPDWLEWVKGIHSLWPENEGRILTNGSLLDKNKDKLNELYSIMAESKGKLTLRISLHNKDRYDEILKWAQKFLGPSMYLWGNDAYQKNFINSYNNIKSENWPNISSIDDWYKLDKEIQNECINDYNLSVEILAKTQYNDWYNETIKNQDPNNKQRSLIMLENSDNVKVLISSEDLFFEAAIQYDQINKEFYLLNSDPDVAHDNCQAKCIGKGFSVPIFFNGKVYKCLNSKLIPDFDNQYYLPLSNEDRSIIHSYKPASLDMSIPELKEWFRNMHKKIHTCKFCPETYAETHFIKAGTKKIFIKKKPKSQQ